MMAERVGYSPRFYEHPFLFSATNSTDFGPQQTPKTPRNRVSELNSGRRVISSSGPIVIAQPNRRKCRGASRTRMSGNSICTTTSARTQTHFFIIRNQLVGARTENAWTVLILLSGNRLPAFCPVAALEPRDPSWQAFLSYASQVLAGRHPSLVGGPPSAE